MLGLEELGSISGSRKQNSLEGNELYIPSECFSIGYFQKKTNSKDRDCG